MLLNILKKVEILLDIFIKGGQPCGFIIIQMNYITMAFLVWNGGKHIFGKDKLNKIFNKNNKNNKKNNKNNGKKSKHRLKIEQQYRKLGYSEKDAIKKADNKIKTEKILAGIAGVSIALGAAYAANKIYKNKFDRIIKSR